MKQAIIVKRDGKYVVLVLREGIWVEDVECLKDSLDGAISCANKKGYTIIKNPTDDNEKKI